MLRPRPFAAELTQPSETPTAKTYPARQKRMSGLRMQRPLDGGQCEDERA